MADGVDDQGETSYERTVAGLEALGALVKNLINALLAANGMSVHSVVHRVKEKSSALEKVQKKSERYTDFASLTDLLGLRIITFFEDEVDSVSALIEKEFQVDRDNSVDKRQIIDSDRFGYLSVHYIVEVSKGRSSLIEYSKFAGIKFEIQIRSILQHAWAEIEHDIGYKVNETLPRNLRRRFSRLAGLLEVADSEFKALREASRAYAQEVEVKIEKSQTGLALDQETVIGHVRGSEISLRLDISVADAMHATLEQSLRRTYIARQGGRLQRLGVRSVEELSQTTAKRFEEIVEFARIYASDLTEDEKPDNFHVPRGIGYLYLTFLLLSDRAPGERRKLLDDFNMQKGVETDEIGRVRALLDDSRR
ncbi:hypothetical protein AB0M80_32410 [Amycolatopsis sp. NPDC051045]|uniref:GTP pyrophosphokinase n=1 Tax=Amycolatopsis sp. NPDC051045 TaxID=3156922 RepID=UPI0034190A34